MKVCSIEGCDKTAKTRGLCIAHYTRLLRHGDPLKGATPRASSVGSPAKYFAEVVTPFNGDECLIWPFHRMDNGYATRRRGVGSKLVHRQACEERHGPPPDPDLLALHSCGNGHLGCVNPKHLRWGTRKDNGQDAVVLGEIAFGERHYAAKKTAAQVREIRALRGVMRNKDVAAKYGIGSSHVSAIWAGRMWRRA